MLDLTLITVGKIKNGAFKAAADDYLKRIKPFARLEIIEVRPEPFDDGNKEKAKREEAFRIQEIILRKKGAQVYLLAEEGHDWDSVSLAKHLEKVNGPIVLIIAGALGWPEELRQKYPRISLSHLTMPHELARVVLLEQLYRAALILAGKEYHY